MLSVYSIRIVGSSSRDIKEKLLNAFQCAGFIPKPEGNDQQEEQDDGGGKLYTMCVDSVGDNACTETTLQPYDYRYIWAEQSSVEECVESFQNFINALNDKNAGKEADDGNNPVGSVGKQRGRFVSTRGRSDSVTFIAAIREGIAKDGGLYVPTRFLTMMPSQLAYFCQAPGLCYNEATQIILEQLMDDTMNPLEIKSLIKHAYDPDRWCDKQDICPVVPLLSKEAGSATSWYQDIAIMELFHGPTAAFKDFGLQLFGLMFKLATEEGKRFCNCTDAGPLKDEKFGSTDKQKNAYMILTATSGDTGAATISGFTNAGGKCRIMVLYPMNGVSPVQKLHMVSCDDGVRVRVLGIDTSFDFCQKSAKDIFIDPEILQNINALDPPLRFSSANSINWGRFIPQVVYYCWAYRQFVQRTKELVRSGRDWSYGDPYDLVVPSGNFGNILAGYVAKIIGFPIRKLIVASNTNDVLYDFIQTGCYDIRSRQMVPTVSPSIDILKASNVERFLYMLSDGNTEFVSSAMSQLETQRYFQLPDGMRKRMQESFEAGRCNEEECGKIIKEVFEVTGGRQLIDPHTAVAMHAAKLYRQRELENLKAEPHKRILPLLVLSTAHWSKFPEPVLHAIKGEVMTMTPCGASQKETLKHVQKNYTEILEFCRSKYPQEMKYNVAEVHPALVKVLKLCEAQTQEPRAVSEDINFVKAQVMDFATL